MSWRDRYRPGSFRGVPFKLRGLASSGGRRLVSQEYPGRDEPYVEDLGRAGRSYRFDAYVIGADYEYARDALIAALEQPGEGTLVHPTMGNLTVAAQTYDIEETAEEGGMCRFSLSFIEAGENTYPVAASDTLAKVRASADSALIAFASSFNATYDVASWPAFVAQSAADQIETMAALAAGLSLGPSGLTGAVAAARGTLFALLNRIAGDPLAVAQGADTAATIQAVTGGVTNSASDAETGYAALGDLSDYGAGLTPETAATPSRIIMAANTSALGALISRSALAEQVRAVSYMGFASYDDASARRQELVGRLWDAALIAADAGDGAGFTALRQLAAAVTTDLTARGATLARVISYETPRGLPALVLAHRLYGDAGRADELAARNHVAHPLFMPARGQALSS